MAVHTFYSTDTGAPTVTGQAGGILALLRAVLINGYNTHSTGVSITRSGATATVTRTAHGYRTGHIIQISGATETDYNGVFRITVTGANTFTYTVPGTPTTPATGSITVRVSPAVVGGTAWTEPFTGTNVAVFRAPVGTRRRYFRFADNTTSLAYYRGFEDMTDVDTGTGPFPTVAQYANGMSYYKSSTTDATARPWVVITNGSMVYLRIQTNATTTPQMYWAWFGDFPSERSGDEFNTIIAGGRATTLDQNNVFAGMSINAAGAGEPQAFLPRPFNQVGSAIIAVKYADVGFTRAGTSWGNTMGLAGISPFPAPINAGVYLTPVYILESSGNTYTGAPIRGVAPGLWAPCHQKPFLDLETFVGTGALAGKTFIALDANQNSSGQAILEISDTW